MMRLLRLAAAWTFSGAYWLVFALISALTLKKLPADFLQMGLRRWGRLTLAILGLRVELQNASTLETRGPRVVVFNHQSGLDMLWVGLTAPPAMVALGKKEVLFIPVVNLAWWILDFRFVDRHHARRAAASIDGVAEEVAEGKRSLLIAPEGTRTLDGRVGPFKRGAFVVAIRSGAPVYPIVVDGAYDLLPKPAWLPKPGVIRLRFLPPVPTTGLVEKDAHALGEKVRGMIVDAYEEMRSHR